MAKKKKNHPLLFEENGLVENKMRENEGRGISYQVI